MSDPINPKYYQHTLKVIRMLGQRETALRSLHYHRLRPEQRDELALYTDPEMQYYLNDCGLPRQDALRSQIMTPF